MEIAFFREISRDDVRLQFVVSGAVALGIVGFGVWLWLLGKMAFLLALPALGYALRRAVQPYFELRRQLAQPDKFVLENNALTYIASRKETLRIPLSGIRSVSFRDGLCISMHPNQRWEVLDPKFPLSQFLAASRPHATDLFFPQFGPSVQARLQEIVEMEQPHHRRPLHHR